MTVGGMYADTERTGTYLQRVMSTGLLSLPQINQSSFIASE